MYDVVFSSEPYLTLTCSEPWQILKLKYIPSLSNIYDKVFYSDPFLTIAYSLCKKCRYSELFWSVFSRMRTYRGEIRGISLHSVRKRAKVRPE